MRTSHLEKIPFLIGFFVVVFLFTLTNKHPPSRWVGVWVSGGMGGWAGGWGMGGEYACVG